ncbi:hypothetical protein VOLCADRAFT_91370 [Volvox carteri f. nagariensis]|uniref:Uncharacterized protein n=1 Tax=Volvox carteri f. nagariensis TaxID=3068 RepID=D8TWW3_VOLCA|nr:uncharacterized protein VOLCADRAFT_91370 [Volvox carteri f. nagariensis]EFJ48222.1 hypothetical protein VOLCADRAFT_91370 [Volvox carteri f. nagariensis]|eukprot:XP_002950907.1 hypothetical protein VOLCADRAFT_91370 [Volvox carteri f. nagariensis]
MAVPSLLDLCIQAAANSVHWTVQRRSLERLPEHAANELLELLLLRQSPFLGGTTTAKAALLTGGVKEGRVVGRGGDRGSPAAAAGGGSTPLRPATLELFLHSVTRVRLWGPAVTLEWLAALSGFSHLETLTLTGCSKLTAAALQPLIFASGRPPASPTLTASPALTPAATSLRHLDISGCSRLGDEALPALASLSCLLSLNITAAPLPVRTFMFGYNVLGSPFLRYPCIYGPNPLAVSALAGGCLQRRAVGDEAWLSLLPHLPALRHLDLWGSDAGGGPDGGEQLLLLLAAGLPLLRYLGAAWTQLSTVPALPELEFLDLRHCWLREVWWPAGQPSPLALRQLLLRGAVLSGQLAAADDPPYSPAGLACVIRRSLRLQGPMLPAALLTLCV